MRARTIKTSGAFQLQWQKQPCSTALYIAEETIIYNLDTSCLGMRNFIH